VEKRYTSTLSLTSVLDGVGGQLHTPAALPPGKRRYPMYRRLGGPQGRSRRVRKIFSSPGFDPRAFQNFASRYTDWAIPAHLNACHGVTILVIVLLNLLVWESTDFKELAGFLFLLVGAVLWWTGFACSRKNPQKISNTSKLRRMIKQRLLV